jgi:PAS domain S-box-containing protein
MTRILVADDNPENLYLLVSLLEGHGYEVVAAANGAEALALAQDSPPDLILSDLLMPLMDGFELCRRWKQDERLRRIPFIIYTATYTDPADEELALSLGADRFLVKPQNVELLIEAVRETLEETGRDPTAVRPGAATSEAELAHRHTEAVRRKLEKRVRALDAETARRAQAESALRAANDFWQITFDALLDPVALVSSDGTVTRANRAMGEHLGQEARDLVGEKCYRLIHGTNAHIEGCPLLASRKSGRRETMELVIQDKTFLVVVDPVPAAPGQEPGYLHILHDVTPLKRIERDLRQTSAFLDSMIENLPLMVFLKDARELRFARLNRAGEELLGWARTDLLGKSVSDLFPAEKADPLERRDREALRGREVLDLTEELWPTRDRGLRVFHTQRVPLLNAQGEPEWLLGIAQDMTERKRAEETRERLRNELFQAQKMESVGRLAGGVAHDFNNLLSVILNCAGFAIDALPGGDPLRADLEEIQRAGERAAALTRQLLAFSRKQVFSPETLNLRTVISGMEGMLRRLLGEDIQVEVHLAENLGSVRADRGQIEQVILNLAINSRDAMPRGGRLILEAANVEIDEGHANQHVAVQPGPYVRLSVTDTGTGMDAQTQEHLFEPFFTTKEKGKGTGLGLSTVYGIVKQSGGHIWVYSEPGQGTTFKVYLPRVEDLPAEARSQPAPHIVTGSETVLVVEDEPAVRRLIERILRGAGYQVLGAATGNEALALCEKQAGGIDLLLTDVVMPQMSGRELAERLAKLCPRLKVLYMSGYTEDAIVHHGVLDPDTQFIAKPFATADLARKVREVLEAG